MALNRFVCNGRLVRDPELRTTQNGNAVTTFCVAVERDFKDKQTGKREADFIDFVAYKNTAQYIKQYFTKGMMAVVEGRLQIRNFIDKEGNKRYVTEILVNNIYFGESKKANQDNSTSSIEQGGKEMTDTDDGTLPFN